jgi:hypothetical protein
MTIYRHQNFDVNKLFKTKKLINKIYINVTTKNGKKEKLVIFTQCTGGSELCNRTNNFLDIKVAQLMSLI